MEAKSAKVLDPLITTIIVALIGFIGTTVGTIVNNSNNTALESRKFEFDLIKKGLEQPSEEERVKFLRFLSELKLISNPDMVTAIDNIIENPENVPNLSVAVSQPGQFEIDVKSGVKEKDFRIGAIGAARGEIGNMEDKTLGNGGPHVFKYMRGGQGYGWACGFVSWCYSQNINQKPPFKYCYSTKQLQQIIQKKGWYKKSEGYTPVEGDIYFIGNTDNIFHLGIVESVNSDILTGIEGNTNDSGERNGKGVFRMKRKLSSIVGYGHIKQ
ncbi:MAG: CHAP domain-containing protein [Chitinophagaceae bacterium]|nr:CHAP domain-containing protein [Chitinophagaceae bacterium]